MGLNDKRQHIGLIISIFIISFVMNIGMGANDVANSFGSVYGTKLVNLNTVLILSSMFKFTGSMLLGFTASNTKPPPSDIIAKGAIELMFRNSSDSIEINSHPSFNKSVLEPKSATIKQKFIKYGSDLDRPESMQLIGYLSVITSSCICFIVANILRIPVSSTHTIKGGTMGYGFVVLRGEGMDWKNIFKLSSTWIVSPVASGILTVIIWKILCLFIAGKENYYEVGIKLMPLLVFFMISITVFSMFCDGSKILHLNILSFSSVLIISIIVGLLAALIYWLCIAPCIAKYSNTKEFLFNSEYKKIPLHQDSGDGEMGRVDGGGEGGDFIPPQNPSKVQIIYLSSKNDSLEAERNKFRLFLNKTQNLYLKFKHTLLLYFYFQRDNRIDREVGGRLKYLFISLQLIMACYGAFSHGGNDIGNTFTSAISDWHILAKENIHSTMKPSIWITLTGAFGMIIGLILWGYRSLETMGFNIMELTPLMGFSIELASAICVGILTKLGLPISRIHCKVGSLVAIGWIEDRLKPGSTPVVSNIILAGFITVPISAILSGLIFSCLRFVVTELT